jgi:hypothetical protein
MIQESTRILAESLNNVLMQFVTFIPALLIAIVLFVIGLIVAWGLSVFVELIVKSSKLDNLLAKVGVEKYLERSGMKLNSASFLGQVVYWLIMIGFTVSVSKILGLGGLETFLLGLVAFISKLALAVLILLSSIIAANFAKSVVKASVTGAKLHASHFLGGLTWWAIVIFGFLAALEQIGLNGSSPVISLVMNVFGGLINAFTLAAGIAFGLGGKDYAAHLLDHCRNRVEK